jgi:hypothetical protein
VVLQLFVESFDDVVVTAPVRGDRGIDVAGGSIEELGRTAVWAARRKDPFKRCQLAAVVSKTNFSLRQLLHGSARLAVIAEHGMEFTVGGVVEVCVWRVEIDG